MHYFVNRISYKCALHLVPQIHKILWLGRTFLRDEGAFKGGLMSETACINDNIQAKVREIFMLREFMVANQLTSAMSDAIREPAHLLYLSDSKFKNVVDGLTAGFMRLFVENTIPIPADKVTVFCPARMADQVKVALGTWGFVLSHEADKKGGKVLGYEVL